MTADSDFRGGGSEWTRPFAAGLLSAGLFLFFHYGLVFPRRFIVGEFALSFILAAAGYAGFLLILPHPKRLADELADFAGQIGMDGAEMAELLRTSHAKIAVIREINAEIPGEPHDRIERIARSAERIIAGFRDDPEDVHRSWNFLYHYLDATVEIVRQYRELRRKEGGKKVQAVLDKSEATLAEIEDVFERQYQKNLDNEALSLDVDLDVLRRMMKSEGL
jgi:hypothetical protein